MGSPKNSVNMTSGGMASLNLEHCLNIPDDFEGYSKTLFNIPKHYEDCVGNVLIPAGLVQVNPLNFHAKNLIFTRKIVAKKYVKLKLLIQFVDFFSYFYNYFNHFSAKNLIFTRKIVAKKSVKSRLLLHYDDFFHIF